MHRSLVIPGTVRSFGAESPLARVGSLWTRPSRHSTGDASRAGSLRSGLLLGRLALLFPSRCALPARRLTGLGARAGLSADCWCFFPAMGGPGTLAGQVEINARDAQIRFGGRLHSQLATSSAEEGKATDFFTRRARFTLDIRVSPLLDARVQPDFGGGKLELKDAYFRLDFDAEFPALRGPVQEGLRSLRTRQLDRHRGRGKDGQDRRGRRVRGDRTDPVRSAVSPKSWLTRTVISGSRRTVRSANASATWPR